MGKSILHENITPEIAQKALDSGADINERCHDILYYETPLAIAAVNGNLELVKFLIDKGADVTSLFLLRAPLSDVKINEDIIKYVVQIGYPKSNKNLIYDYPKFQYRDIISRYGTDEQKNKLEVEFIEAWISFHYTKLYKGDINQYNSLLLFRAIDCNNYEWVKYLIDKGINKNVCNEQNKMPIQCTNNQMIIDLLKSH